MPHKQNIYIYEKIIRLVAELCTCTFELSLTWIVLSCINHLVIFLEKHR